MKKIRAVYERMRGLLPMAMYTIVYLLGFSLLERRRTVHYTEIHMWLDDRIPFAEIFVIPYFLWFAFVVVAVLYLYWFDRKNYDRTATMLYIGMTVFLVVSYLFPNIQYLRPHSMPRHNVLTMLVSYLYRTDTSTNVFPSIHVYNTLCCMAGIFRSRHHIAQNKWVKAGTGLLGVSIILSTMFLKQHSVVDVLGAIAMYMPLHVLVFNYDVVIASRRKRALLQR